VTEDYRVVRRFPFINYALQEIRNLNMNCMCFDFFIVYQIFFEFFLSKYTWKCY